MKRPHEITDEEWLENRCRMMLTDFLEQCIKKGVNNETSNEAIDWLVDDFMYRHHLSQKRRFDEMDREKSSTVCSKE